MRRVAQGKFLGNYTTSNGFCACPIVPEIQQSQCLISAASLSSTPCSLAETVQALKAVDSTYYTSHVHIPIDNDLIQRKCRMSLDWPAVDGEL